jgi:hypothetical protein
MIHDAIELDLEFGRGSIGNASLQTVHATPTNANQITESGIGKHGDH